MLLLMVSQISRMAFVEIQVDPKYHRHIIGKQGANSEYMFFGQVAVGS
jgi:hypothetical protein